MTPVNVRRNTLLHVYMTGNMCKKNVLETKQLHDMRLLLVCLCGLLLLSDDDVVCDLLMRRTLHRSRALCRYLNACL